MAKRLNDTNAIASKPIRGGMRMGESTHIEVRPIDNGYIKRESKSDDMGNYKSSETYHSEKPSLDITGANTKNALKAATDYLNQSPTAANK